MRSVRVAAAPPVLLLAAREALLDPPALQRHQHVVDGRHHEPALGLQIDGAGREVDERAVVDEGLEDAVVVPAVRAEEAAVLRDHDARRLLVTDGVEELVHRLRADDVCAADHDTDRLPDDGEAETGAGGEVDAVLSIESQALV